MAVARADDVQYLDAGVAEPLGGPEHRGVQRPRPLRAAGHQQHGQVGAQAEVGACLVAEPQPVKLSDLAPDRDAEVLAVPELGIWVTGEDVGGEPGAKPVGQPRLGVGLVHDDRDLAPPGREVGRCGDVPAEPDEHLGLRPVERGGGRVDGASQPTGHSEQLGRHGPGHRHGRDELQRVAAQRDQPGLQAAFGAQAGHLCAGVNPAQGVGQRQRWFDVTGGPAASKQYPHATSLNCAS